MKQASLALALALLLPLLAALPRLDAASVTLDAFETLSNVTVNNCTSVSIIDDGAREVMQGTSTTNDPQIVIPNIVSALNAEFNTTVFTQVQIGLYVDATTTTQIQVFFTTAASPTFTSAKSIHIDPTGYRGQYHVYTVDMSGVTDWTGSTLTNLRVDPFSESGKTFKIDFINLLSTGGDTATVQPQVMNILWRVNVNGRDRMTTFRATERDANPCDGQIFYVPSAAATGLETLNRFLKSTTPTDHRDSLLATLSGYSLEGAIGYPSIAVQTGMVPLMEAYSTTNSDYATVNPASDSLLVAGTGYTLDAIANNGFGYPCFDNSFGGNSPLTLTVGGITVGSNLVAGGAIWTWTWNGTQFINDCDYGRQGQSSFFFPYTYGGTLMEPNPTEAGSDYAGVAGGSGQNLLGSPNLAGFNIGNTQVTRAIPVEWAVSHFGGSAINPVLWPGITLGKDLTLNYRGMSAVALYTTTLHTAAPLTAMAPVGAPSHGNPIGVEIPTIYLRSIFSSFYTYDATGSSGAGTLTATTIPVYPATGYNYFFTPTYGGVIAATSDSNFAMGIYGVTTGAGGAILMFSINNYTGLGGSGGQFDAGTVKLGTNAYPAGSTGTLAAGDYVYNSYIVTGTLSQVTAAMHQLYTLRGTIPQ